MQQINIKEAINAAGGRHVVKAACGLKSYQAVMKWEDKNSLPRSEFSGETNYAETIANLCRRNGHRQFSKQKLLLVSKRSRAK